MKTRALVVALAFVPFIAAHAAGEFTPTQQAEIVATMRDALKSDPSILRDATAALQADDAKQQAAGTAQAIAANRLVLFHNADDPEAGAKSGSTTIVEFYDARCPYCRRMLPSMAALLAQDHDIRLIYKDIPVLGRDSEMEARAMIAAQQQGAYLKLQAALMTDAAPATEEMIMAHARALGLDLKKLAAGMTAQRTIEKLNTNLQLAHALHVDGTPAFVIGDQIIPGQVGIPTLEAALAAARIKG